MPSANHLRAQIEASLANRFPSALTPNQVAVREVTTSGIDAVDAVMQGGVPRGAITEIVGKACSGRMSFALAYATAIIRTGSACAWVDGGDGLCPEDAAANGVDLEYLLWVRCGSLPQRGSRIVVPIEESKANTLPVTAAQPRHTGGSPHPRSEANNMPQEISAMLKAHGGLDDKQLRRENKAIGTPGQPNRPVTSWLEGEEQINSDRLPPRRGANLVLEPRCAEPQSRRVANIPSSERLPVHQLSASAIALAGARGTSWQAIDQAVRATDLLLQGGGFSAIVLDLGSVPPEMAWRIPLATWFRFRAACERTRTSLLLLTQHGCARSSAELVMSLQAGSMEAEGKVMTGIRYRAALERSRSNESAPRIIPIRKQPHSERCGQWMSGTSYAIGSQIR
jgi:recombination protein RecA